MLRRRRLTSSRRRLRLRRTHVVVVKRSMVAATGPRCRSEILIDRTPPAKRSTLASRAATAGGPATRSPSVGETPRSRRPDRSGAVRALPCANSAATPATAWRGSSGGGRRRDHRPPCAEARRVALSLWLEDEAGNADRERAVTVGVLRFDDDVPTLQDRAAGRSTTRRASAPSPRTRRRVSPAARSRPAARARTRGDRFRRRSTQAGSPRRSTTSRSRVAATSCAHASWTARATSARRRRCRTARRTRTLPLRVGTRLAVGAPKRIRARNAKGKWRYPHRASREPAGPLRPHDPAAGPADDARARTRSPMRTSRSGSASSSRRPTGAA